MKKNSILTVCGVFISLFFFSCSSKPEVTIYCALDQRFSEPLLRDFEKETGIKVNAIFDIEANKTVGLVRTLIEEKNNPKCDVFWNNELAQTIKLKRAGVLQPYASPLANGIPENFRDKENYWTGLAARARVFIVNSNMLKEEEFPSSLKDLVNPAYQGKFTLAKPLTGTTITHFSALFALWGEESAKEFCQNILGNEPNLAQGNAHVSKLVAKGKIPFGLTDTDDFRVRQEEGHPVRMIYPDAATVGTLLIPNSVAMIKGAPHPEAAKKLIDWILNPSVEARLAAGSSAQIPLRPGVKRPDHIKVPGDFNVLKVDWEKVADQLNQQADYFRETFAK